METLSVVNAVANKLRESHSEMNIIISPIDPKGYIPCNQQPTVLIHYYGSIFTAPVNTDSNMQIRTLQINVAVIVPEISEAINALDKVRNSLGGITLPDCESPLWLANEKSLGESEDICRYILEMATSALFIADRESKDLPLLNFVNYEEI
ncbi:Gp37 family protein [Dryocola sp. BD626]|uniref:Gp37 family protein n=1 Tax=Dryocola sp. BD626 TaxID=3133273 RepID=UPI003F4F5238